MKFASFSVTRYLIQRSFHSLILSLYYMQNMAILHRTESYFRYLSNHNWFKLIDHHQLDSTVSLSPVCFIRTSAHLHIRDHITGISQPNCFHEHLPNCWCINEHFHSQQIAAYARNVKKWMNKYANRMDIRERQRKRKANISVEENVPLADFAIEYLSRLLTL